MQIGKNQLIRMRVVVLKIAINRSLNCINGSFVCKQCNLIPFWKLVLCAQLSEILSLK